MLQSDGIHPNQFARLPRKQIPEFRQTKRNGTHPSAWIPAIKQSILSGIINALPLIIFIVYEYIGFLGPKHNVTNYDMYWLGGMLKTFVLPSYHIHYLK